MNYFQFQLNESSSRKKWKAYKIFLRTVSTFGLNTEDLYVANKFDEYQTAEENREYKKKKNIATHFTEGKSRIIRF